MFCYFHHLTYQTNICYQNKSKLVNIFNPDRIIILKHHKGRFHMSFLRKIICLQFKKIHFFPINTTVVFFTTKSNIKEVSQMVLGKLKIGARLGVSLGLMVALWSF